jgi:hypothetical protein
VCRCQMRGLPRSGNSIWENAPIALIDKTSLPSRGVVQDLGPSPALTPLSTPLTYPKIRRAAHSW